MPNAVETKIPSRMDRLLDLTIVGAIASRLERGVVLGLSLPDI